ncbi:unnamed protein product [Heligmosomoides polygyrus]|uniref:HTH_48 domain-containing protein n=1 Tax=Heligmosomoides polygyrus TaxID=6339 RepID=A0A183FRS6_HELPZ|nr:unnamed protein product [Heligmosomoides polygyrus]
METKMLRWTAGITRTDRMRNDAIRQKFGVAPIADKKLACDGTATFCVERKTASASAGSGKVASSHQNSGPHHEAGQTLKKKKIIEVRMEIMLFISFAIVPIADHFLKFSLSQWYHLHAESLRWASCVGLA